MQKRKKLSVSSVLALCISICALLFALCALYLWRGTKLDSQLVHDRESASSGSTVADSRDESVMEMDCWDHDFDFCKHDSWKWQTSAFDTFSREHKNVTYTIRLGDFDSDNEIRHLLIRDESGRIAKVGQLPMDLTYMKAIAEGDASPVNNSPDRLTKDGDPIFGIEVFNVTPLEGVGDRRLPVLIKYISPPFEF